MKKRIVTLLLVIGLLLVIPINASADAETSYNKILKISSAGTLKEIIDSEDEIVAALRTGLLNHEEVIEIRYIAFVDEYDIDVGELVAKAAAIDDKSNAKDCDYLLFSLEKWESTVSTKAFVATLTFEPTYKYTLAEEQAVDKKIKSVLKALKLENASDYKKVKAIHDYIIKRVSYDTTLQKASAYHALIEKSAVCEGYSMAAYRMFSEAGVECRIITGSGNGGSHGWNIVKIKDKWYNIDLTWDDPISSDGTPMLVYDYFLKSTKDFIGHKRDNKYKTEEFVKTYPISKTSYVMK